MWTEHRQFGKAAFVIAGVVCCLNFQLFSQSGNISGKWEWRGDSGWQRLILDLHEDRGKLTGTVTAGPGPGTSSNPDDYWEYFFNPAVFKITKGTVRGNAFSFEHVSLTPVEFNVLTWAEMQEFTVNYTGKVEGDQLYLTREIHKKWPFQLRFRNVRNAVVFERYPSRKANQTGFAEPISRKLPTPSTAYVGVADSQGNPVRGLSSRDFQIRQGESLHEVRSVVSPEAAWNIQVLVDIDAFLLSPISWSGSSVNAGPDAAKTWARLGTALSSLYRQLRPQDRLRVDEFFNEVVHDTLIDWTNGGKKTLTVSVTTKSPWRGVGETPDKDIYGTIRKAAERFRNSGANNLILVLTDGRDGRFSQRALRSSQWLLVLDPFVGVFDAGEDMDFAETVEAVQESGVRLNILLVNADRPTRPISPGIEYLRAISGALAVETKRAAERMAALATATGGGVLFRGDTDQALSFLVALPDMLRMRDTYRVEFTRVPNSPATTPEIVTKDPSLIVIQSTGGIFRSVR